MRLNVSQNFIATANQMTATGPAFAATTDKKKKDKKKKKDSRSRSKKKDKKGGGKNDDEEDGDLGTERQPLIGRSDDIEQRSSRSRSRRSRSRKQVKRGHDRDKTPVKIDFYSGYPQSLGSMPDASRTGKNVRV